MKRVNKFELVSKYYPDFIIFLDYHGYAPDQYYITKTVSLFGRISFSNMKLCRSIGEWFNRSRGQSFIPFTKLHKINKVMDFTVKDQILFGCSVKSLTARLHKQAIFFSSRETLEYFLKVLNDGRDHTNEVVLTEDVKEALCRYPIRKKPSPLDLCKP